MNERFAGLLVERPDIRTPKLYLERSGPAFYRHETLAQYSRRSRRLLERIEQLGPYELTGTDLLHADYTLGNVLFDGTEISGVVDWGVLRGDRRFALVGLRFDLAWTAMDQSSPVSVDPGAVARLDQHLEALLEPAELLRYWAHWTLRQLDWTISHHGQADIELHLELGESRLG
jgi:aminoglycoside phosphotransferase (APT) family kinase protein